MLLVNTLLPLTSRSSFFFRELRDSSSLSILSTWTVNRSMLLYNHRHNTMQVWLLRVTSVLFQITISAQITCRDSREGEGEMPTEWLLNEAAGVKGGCQPSNHHNWEVAAGESNDGGNPPQQCQVTNLSCLPHSCVLSDPTDRSHCV